MDRCLVGGKKKKFRDFAKQMIVWCEIIMRLCLSWVEILGAFEINQNED